MAASTNASSAVRALALELKNLQDDPLEGIQSRLVNEDNIFDTESISDESEFEFPSSENINLNAPNARRRQYRSELDKLNVGFPLPASKMRSGRL